MAQGTYRGYETPAYTVERTLRDGAEIRAYTPHLLAEVTVPGDRSQALQRGFGVLAGYIFGGNSGSASVAMTSPVTQRQSESIAMTSPVTQTGSAGAWTVTFMMPSDYTRDTLPVPDNTAIRFFEAPAERQVVLTFAGFATDRALEKQVASLRQLASAEGLAISGNPIFHFYDDPFTAPWNRRNEVAFVLE
jgi:hypothetical protein